MPTRFKLPTGPKPPTIRDQYQATFTKMLEEGFEFRTNSIVIRQRIVDAANEWLKRNGHENARCFGRKEKDGMHMAFIATFNPSSDTGDW